MKQLHRILCLAALSIVANSFVTSYAYAQEATEKTSSPTNSFVAPYVYVEEVVEKKSSPSDFKISVKTGILFTYDFYPYNANDTFIPSVIPLKDDNGQRFNFAPPELGINFKKNLRFGEETIQCAAATTLSAKNGVKVKRVYVDHKYFLVGIYFSNFVDADAAPETLVGDLPCSTVCPSVAQGSLKYQQGAISYTLGSEQAQECILYPEIKKEKRAKQNLVPTNNIPAFSAQTKYEDTFGHVRIGSLVRIVDYYKNDTNEYKYLPTWGLNLTTSINLIPEKTTLKLQGIYGTGIGSYLIDFRSIPEDKNEEKDVYFKEDDQPATIGTWGGYAGIEHRWLPKLRSTVVYGILDTTTNADRKDDDAYRQGHYASGSLTYHPTEQLNFGVEYLYGKRFAIKKDDDKDAHRLQGSINFSI